MAQQPVANLEQYVDVEDALKRVCGSKALYKKLLGKFKTTVQMEQLLQEVASGDLEAAAKTVHSIKGVAANLSLKAAYEKCVEAEANLKQGVAKEEDLTELKDIVDTTILCTDYLIETLA
jgi:HPt (histidine-containing phosphotransfer) domain-containing protein